MKRRLDRLKQAALERIGVAESTDVPKIKEDYKKVKGDEILFKELLKQLEKQMVLLNGFVESGEGIRTNIAAWEKVAMDRGENFKLVEGLKRYGEFQNSLNQLFAKLQQSMTERVVEITKNFVKVDIAEARSQKKKWVKLRQMYDASEANLAAAEKANKGKADEIKEEHNEVMRSYLKSEIDTSAILAKTLKGSEILLVDLIGQYWGVYSSLFLQAHQLGERVKTSLESLQLTPSGGTRAKSMSSPPPRTNPEPTKDPPRLPRVPATKIFGIYLQDLWNKESRSFPRNLVQVLEHLEEHGPNEEEIFKSPGNAKHVTAIKKGLDEGIALNSCGGLGDTLSVAVVLRDFLLQLPIPVVPSDVFPNLIQTQDLAGDTEKIDAILKLHTSLPEPHKVFFDMVIHMAGIISRKSFTDIIEKTKANKFSNDLAIDLAVVLGPACMRPSGISLDPPLEAKSINLFKFLILNADALCPVQGEILPETSKSPPRGRASVTSTTELRKLEITQQITELINGLDMVKMRAGAAITFEECTPFVLDIKNVLQNIQKLKPMVTSEVPRVNKSALQGSEDKLVKAQNAVKVFSDEIQAILLALKNEVSLQSNRFSQDQWQFLSATLSSTQGMLVH